MLSLLVVGLFAFDLVYLLSWGLGTAVLFLLIVCTVFVLGIQLHLFPLIARFDMNTKPLLRTSASLSILHLPTTLLALILNGIPFAVFAYDPILFFQTGILWVGIWFSLVAYINGRILLKVWQKHLPPENSPESTK